MIVMETGIGVFVPSSNTPSPLIYPSARLFVHPSLGPSTYFLVDALASLSICMSTCLQC